MRFFVRLRAWQMFLVLVGPVVLLQALGPHFIFAGGGTLFVAALYGWVFAIGFYANQRLPDNLRRSHALFTAGLIYATVYASLLFLFVLDLRLPDFYILPFHLLAMAGAFYGLWFSARQLTTLKENRELKFIEYSGPLFLMWFFPLGVWFIQPMVNRYIASNTLTANDSDA